MFLILSLGTLSSTGCLVLEGPSKLQRLLHRRPDSGGTTTVFSREPISSERPFSELERTLRYWNEEMADGTPRFLGVLKPDPPNLYAQLLAEIDAGASAITLVSYKFDAIGWDDLTVVDYYVGGELAGADHTEYGRIAAGRSTRRTIGYDDLAWWEYPQFLLDVPVYAAVGLKELLAEVIKSPLSAFEAGWIGPAIAGRSPVSPACFRRAGGALAEDWRNGAQALTWRFRVREGHTPADLARELLASLPLVGSLFEDKAPLHESTQQVSRLFVSQGIYAGGDDEQHVGAWARRLRELRAGTDVVVLPYRYGGAIDVVWSVFNLSHGFAYDASERIALSGSIPPGSSIDLVGFSGGGQRFLVSSRLLRRAGIGVRSLSAIASPVQGSSCGLVNVVLRDAGVANDPVVLTARLVDGLFFLLPDNLRRVDVAGAGRHHTPYFPNGTTRAPESGYASAFESVVAPARE